MVRLLALLLGLLASGQALAQGMSENIIAVVNDSVITRSDFENRFKLGMISAGLPDDPEARKRLQPQIMRTLIEEQIQLQEAKRLDIAVTQEEIDLTLKRIASENSIPMDMKTFIAQQGGSPRALENQIRAGIAWNKVIQRTLRPRVEIGDDEIEAAIDRLRSAAGKQEFLVSEIYLANDNPAEEAQVQEFADKLKAQLDQGASFPVMARQFSQGTGAIGGGDLGWVQEGQLAGEIDRALQSAAKGTIIGPIKTSIGLHILAVRDMRTINAGAAVAEPMATVLQMVLPITATRDRAAAKTAANALRDTLNTCVEAEKRLSADPEWKVMNMGNKPISELPSWLGGIAASQGIERPTAPLPVGNGMALFMVCDRAEPTGPDRDAIVNAIGMERLDNLARRQLRDLKRTAYIDIRS